MNMMPVDEQLDPIVDVHERRLAQAVVGPEDHVSDAAPVHLYVQIRQFREPVIALPYGGYVVELVLAATSSSTLL